MKLGGLKDQQLIEQNFSEELIFEKKPKFSFKQVFFGFCQKFNQCICLFYLKMVNKSVLYDSGNHFWENTVGKIKSGKTPIFQLWPKIMISTNQIAVFFDYYLWKESIYNLDFLHGDFVTCGCGQLCQRSIQIARFFYHQYLRKEFSIILASCIKFFAFFAFCHH